MFIILNDLRAMEKYAEEYNIPIMERRGLKFLVDYIKSKNVKSILEIGTAIGYSAINMALSNPGVSIVSIEKDEVRYLEAIKNVKKFKLDKQITLILGDALNLELTEKYDLIFIDAAKGQYVNFFEKYSQNLNDKGTIISDNIYFHGLIEQNIRIEKKNLRQLVDKIKKYILFLEGHEEFKTEFYKIGDGIAVSRKRVITNENRYITEESE
ncbi:MAG: O-methyltransferase [Bacilli bacterium]|jgi:predicted O-methyltransferase YrrM